MLRLTEEEIRDTMKLYAIDRGLINLVVNELQAIESCRARKVPNGATLEICRYLEDGRSASAREIADNIGQPANTVRNMLHQMGDRVGKLMPEKSKSKDPVLWHIEKPGIDYIREKEARGY